MYGALIDSRSKDIIEPLLKPQWYVKMEKMSQEAVRVGVLFLLGLTAAGIY